MSKATNDDSSEYVRVWFNDLLVKTGAPDSRGMEVPSELEHAGLEALWMYQASDAPTKSAQELLGCLLKASDHRVRAAAVRVLGVWAGATPGIPTLAKSRVDSSTALELLAKRITDDHPRVRIEALRALARIPTARAAELALSVLDKGQVDGFLEYALWLTINDLAEPWAAAVESGAWNTEGREKQLQYALKAIEPRLATRLMAKVIGKDPLPRDGSGGLVELIGQAGSSLQMRMMFDQVLTGGFNDEGALRALNSLLEAARLRNVRPSGDPTTISKLLENPNDSIRAAAAKLVGTWKQASLAPTLNKLAGDAGASTSLRQSAIEGLRELGGRDAVASLRTLSKDKDEPIRRSAAAALAATDLNGSMPQILEVVSATTKEEDALTLWRSLLATKGASSALTKALTTNSLPESAAKAGLRAAREGGRNEPNLVLALNRAGSLSDPSAALNENEIHAIAYEVTKGNPVNGEKIYRNKQLGCVLCHAIGGAGGKVGPDMTSLGASTPVADYIVESVLLPNKRVKEGYNSVQIATKDGEDLSGNLVREDNEQVILRDATAKEVSVPKRNIQSRKMGGSLMPAGLLDFITPQERLDLYAFLVAPGQTGRVRRHEAKRRARLAAERESRNGERRRNVEVRSARERVDAGLRHSFRRIAEVRCDGGIGWQRFHDLAGQPFPDGQGRRRPIQGDRHFESQSMDRRQAHRRRLRSHSRFVRWSAYVLHQGDDERHCQRPEAGEQRRDVPGGVNMPPILPASANEVRQRALAARGCATAPLVTGNNAAADSHGARPKAASCHRCPTGSRRLNSKPARRRSRSVPANSAHRLYC